MKISSFLILGATGDLATRYLVPALIRLHEAEKLPDPVKILALDLDDFDSHGFRRQLEERLARDVPDLPSSSRRALLSAMEYRRTNVSEPDDVASVLEATREPVVAYLAIPPAIFAPAVCALARAGLAPESRIVVEKPFGEDLASAEVLNRLLHETFPETAVFRMDHFLGKQTVQNILGLRFANRIFEPLWNQNHVAKVDIIWEETRALEGRAGYYDRAGALKDMIQNHLLQLLCLVAMEAPASLGERDLRDRKADVMRAVRRLSREDIQRQTVRARYGAGSIGGRKVPAYAEEEGVDAKRSTETFAQAILRIDNWRWAGVPFLLRTGKALAKDRREISVYFRSVPHMVFGRKFDPAENVLRFQLEPDRMSLEVNINGPGDPFLLDRAELDAELAPQEVPAYARLLLDVLEGDPTFSIRGDEAEESWRIVEPILKAWETGEVPLREYAAGSSGPSD